MLYFINYLGRFNVVYLWFPPGSLYDLFFLSIFGVSVAILRGKRAAEIVIVFPTGRGERRAGAVRGGNAQREEKSIKCQNGRKPSYRNTPLHSTPPPTNEYRYSSWFEAGGMLCFVLPRPSREHTGNVLLPNLPTGVNRTWNSGEDA